MKEYVSRLDKEGSYFLDLIYSYIDESKFEESRLNRLKSLKKNITKSIVGIILVLVTFGYGLYVSDRYADLGILLRITTELFIVAAGVALVVVLYKKYKLNNIFYKALKHGRIHAVYLEIDKIIENFSVELAKYDNEPGGLIFYVSDGELEDFFNSTNNYVIYIEWIKKDKSNEVEKQFGTSIARKQFKNNNREDLLSFKVIRKSEGMEE